MMDDSMIALVTVLTAAVGGAIGWWAKIRSTPVDVRKTEVETDDLNVTMTVKLADSTMAAAEYWQGIADDVTRRLENLEVKTRDQAREIEQLHVDLHQSRNREQRLENRIRQLERFLRGEGYDPETINGTHPPDDIGGTPV